MPEKLNFNVIFCEFDEKFGPIPKYSYPEIERGFGLSIASKSMGFIRSDEVSDSKSLAFLPFPKEKKKGIVRNFEWPDSTHRGGVGTGSFTLIFNEADDLIFYKYIKDIETLFETIIQMLIKLKTSSTNDNILSNEVVKIHERILNKLRELSNQEKGVADISEAFPEEDSAAENLYAFKVVVCGDPASGKTSTILKFTDSAFRRTYIPTIGVNITKKDVTIGNKQVSLILWDIAGQMKFKLMRRSFYEGADGILLLFDVTRKSTFNSIPDWYKDINVSVKNMAERAILLCGNKKDLIEQREISVEVAKLYADQLNIEYLEISALTGENIDQTFQLIAQKLINVYKK